MMPDGRYTINLEFCGESTPHYVLRFCGEWCGKYREKTLAEQAARAHNKERTE